MIGVEFVKSREILGTKGTLRGTGDAKELWTIRRMGHPAERPRASPKESGS